MVIELPGAAVFAFVLLAFAGLGVPWWALALAIFAAGLLGTFASMLERYIAPPLEEPLVKPTQAIGFKLEGTEEDDEGD